jgi:mono/diheme cytochrome c family protein
MPDATARDGPLGVAPPDPPQTTRGRSGLALRLAAGLAALAAVLAVSELVVQGTRWQRRVVDNAVALTGGDPGRGLALIERVGCGACHEIPGARGPAAGRVGPSLAGFGARAYVGGVAANQPEHLVRWLIDPRALSPRSAMPALGLSAEEARDIAAYLYTLG